MPMVCVAKMLLNTYFAAQNQVERDRTGDLNWHSFRWAKTILPDLKSIEVDNMRFMKLQIQVQIVAPDIEMEATLVSWGNMTLEPAWLQSVSMPRQDENDRSLIRSLQPI